MPGGWSANLEEVIEGERTGYQPPPFHDRFWEDVREGDELPQLLMPITVTRCIYIPGVQDEIRTFIEGEPELEEWLKQEDLALPESAASPEAEDFLEKLRQRVSEREDLVTVWEGYIEPFVGAARKEVEQLIECLRELGITVHASGIGDPKDPPDDVSVIFIDYTLDDSNVEDVAAESIAEINRIHDALTTPRRPIVVLMSSRTKLVSELKIRFRDRTGIMAGMFFGFQKEELKGIGLHAILNDIAENWPKAVALQSFVHTVAEASHSAAKQVSSLVRRLTLEDFALIQLLKEELKGIRLHAILNDIAENWPKAVALQSFVHTVSEVFGTRLCHS